MALTVTEIEVAIIVAELPRKGEDGEKAPVLVTQIEDELVFSRMDMDSFILEVADALDVTTRGTEVGDFDVYVKRRALDLALRRLSAKERGVALEASLGSGTLQWIDRSRVAYLAPCGERHVFSRRDLESVLETFG